MDYEKLIFIIKNFFINSTVLSINELNGGNINNTYLVEHLYCGRKSRFILQKLSNIFASPENVCMNHKLVSDHINKKINNNYFSNYYREWKVPSLVRCNANNRFIFPFESDNWRVMEYINNTVSTSFLEDQGLAYQVGIGLGKFHLICSDLDPSRIENSIENFHNTKYYLNKYISTTSKIDFAKFDNHSSKRLQSLIYRISHHINYIEILLTSIKGKSIQDNIIHGDPKLTNFLFDSQNKFVVSLIDLDTISSGYFLTDLADCIRSICNLRGEESFNRDENSFDISSCYNLLNGYFFINHYNNLSSFELLPEFIYIIIFELTIRFLTDFLESNIYFKIDYETHNLYRAEVQFELLCSFLRQTSKLSKSLEEIGISSNSTFSLDVQTFI